MDKPTKPVGARTPYNLYLKGFFQDYIKQNPGSHLRMPEITSKCAESWKSMTPEEKLPYERLAKADKERFCVEKAEYESFVGVAKKKRKPKDPNAPKRCVSAFMWFCCDRRPLVKARNPDWGVRELSRELSRQWKESELAVKNHYEAVAAKDRTRYFSEKKLNPGVKKQKVTIQLAVIRHGESDVPMQNEVKVEPEEYILPH